MTLEEAIGYVASDELIEVTLLIANHMNFEERFVSGVLFIGLNVFRLLQRRLG